MNSPVRNRVRVTLTDRSVRVARGFEETYWEVLAEGAFVQVSKHRGETLSSPLGPIRIKLQDEAGLSEDFERIPPGYQFRNVSVVEAPVGAILRMSRLVPELVEDAAGFRSVRRAWHHRRYEIAGPDRYVRLETAPPRRPAPIAPASSEAALTGQESAKRAAALAAMIGAPRG